MNKKNWSKNENGDNETVEFFLYDFLSDVEEMKTEMMKMNAEPKDHAVGAVKVMEEWSEVCWRLLPNQEALCFFSGADSETVVVLILLKLELRRRDEMWWWWWSVVSPFECQNHWYWLFPTVPYPLMPLLSRQILVLQLYIPLHGLDPSLSLLLLQTFPPFSFLSFVTTIFFHFCSHICMCVAINDHTNRRTSISNTAFIF